jgi:PAS domain S-box-containing protein
VLDADALLKSAEPMAVADELLALLGAGFAAHRVVLFRVHDLPGIGLGQTCVADWAAGGPVDRPPPVAVADEPLGSIDPTLAEWTRRRRRGEIIDARRRDLSGLLRSEFERQGILSALSAPIFSRGAYWGQVGVNDCVIEREWTADEAAALEMVARLLGRALGRATEADGLSEAMRAAMVAAAPDAIIVVDEDGFGLEFNPAAETMFGVPREAMIGRPVSDTVTPEHLRAAHAEGFKAYITGGRPKMLGRRVNTEGLRASGEVFPIELTVTEVKAEGRRLFAAHVRDLTQLRAAEREVARQREALYQSEKLNALGSLLAGVAHEMNNPLSVVVGRAMMLEEAVADAAVADQVRRLREAAERCAKISRTFLAIARHAPGKVAPVPVERPVRAALELNAYAFKASGVQVELTVPSPAACVMGDEDQLVQVLSNLLVNAEHALRAVPPPRRAAVAVRAVGDRVEVVVEDNGPGIPAANAGRVFDPFYTTKPVGMGTGVGLSVSRGMVTAMGGTIELDPRPGEGARFTVSLVAAEPSAESVAPAPRPRISGCRRILVVDDEAEVRALLVDILAADGCIVDTAADGAAGLRRIKEVADYDAVLADARMPELDGWSLFAEAIKIRPGLHGRFAIVTGDTLAGVAEPPDGCVTIGKPFEPRQIRAFLAGL